MVPKNVLSVITLSSKEVLYGTVNNVISLSILVVLRNGLRSLITKMKKKRRRPLHKTKVKE
jgi:hypothetical protein